MMFCLIKLTRSSMPNVHFQLDTQISDIKSIHSSVTSVKTSVLTQHAVPLGKPRRPHRAVVVDLFVLSDVL